MKSEKMFLVEVKSQGGEQEERPRQQEVEANIRR